MQNKNKYNPLAMLDNYNMSNITYNEEKSLVQLYILKHSKFKLQKSFFSFVNKLFCRIF